MGETTELPGPAQPFAEGEEILGRFRVVRRLGEGGQGAVFEAEELGTGARVAVKYARLAGAGADLVRRQFEREGRLLRALDHPGLPKVYDTVSGGDFCALVMEYVAGEDLARARSRRGPFDARDVVLWADQLLDVLEYLHAQTPPVLHRDVKPANIKVLPDGRVVLLDFGLARVSQAGQGATANSVVGYTETFAPFEQTQGDPVGPDGDLFSLGATMYWLLAPAPPPVAAARVFAMALGRPDPLVPLGEAAPGVPGFVAAAVHRAMAVHPDERFHTARAMRDALAGLAVGEEDAVTRVRRRRVRVDVPPVAPIAPPPAAPSPEPAARRRAALVPATAAAALLASAAGGAFWFMRDAPAPPPTDPPAAAEAPPAGPPQPVPAPSAFSAELEGEVGGRPGIRMRLERRGPSIAGSFVWADRAGVGDFAETPLEGTVEADGRAVLTEYEPAGDGQRRATGAFSGALLADPTTGDLSFAGTWSTTAGAKQSAFTLRERDLGLPAGAQVMARRRETRGRAPGYEVNAVYPAIEGGALPNAGKFNAEVEAVVSEVVDGWVEHVRDDDRDEASRLTMRYEVTYGGQDLVSVRFFTESFLGGSRGIFWDKGPKEEYAFDAITYDLRAGRRVELEELFRPGAPYRGRIAEAVRAELGRRGVEVDEGDLEDEAYRVWNLVPGGLLVSFAPDEVAPNSAGDVTVLVDHAALQDLYRPGGPAGRS